MFSVRYLINNRCAVIACSKIIVKEKVQLFTCIGKRRFSSDKMAKPQVYVTREINQEALEILKQS